MAPGRTGKPHSADASTNLLAVSDSTTSSQIQGRIHHSLVGKVSFRRQRLRCLNGTQEIVSIDRVVSLPPDQHQRIRCFPAPGLAEYE